MPIPELAIIIPTLGRPERLEKIKENIEKTTTWPHTVYFVVESTDAATIGVAKRLGLNLIINTDASYVSSCNRAFRMTTEPFVLLGSDDIEFMPLWSELMMGEMSNPKIGIVGHFDDWPIGKTGHHGSHLLIRRKYIEQFSGVEDESGVVYSSLYKHFQCDIETEQTAMKRGAYAQSSATIKHHHWVNGQAEKDETYRNGLTLITNDTRVYQTRRRRFEQYLLEALQNGIVVPVNQKKLSIVIGSYNVPETLQATIESLYANTYHEFELILVDDASTDPRTREIINGISQTNCKRFLLPTQGYTTHTWNFGVSKATGDVVVVANNDISFSKWWDVYLMAAFDDPSVYLANPYQTDSGMLTPYGKHDRAGGIDIRGTCFAMSKESVKALFPLPAELVMWFSDYWLAERVKKLKKKSAWIPEAVIHTIGSRSSFDLEREKGTYWWILRGDALQFEKMTGIDTKHWQEVIESHLPFGQNQT